MKRWFMSYLIVVKMGIEYRYNVLGSSIYSDEENPVQRINRWQERARREHLNNKEPFRSFVLLSFHVVTEDIEDYDKEVQMTDHY